MHTARLALAVLAGWIVVSMSAIAAEPAAESTPAPVLKAARIEKDFELDGDLTKAAWQKGTPVHVCLSLKEAQARPELSTTVRCLWSAEYLYLSYECPYKKLTVFEPVSPKERIGLWDKDVVEAFIGSDLKNIRRYTEFEVSPTNERLDLLIIDRPKVDFGWDSKFQSATKIDEKAKVWRSEWRIPLTALCEEKPKTGTRWRLNLYRNDRAGDVFLAWNPTLTETAHTPERFGVLEFSE